ncbi:glycerate kinase [Serratia ureilytica]
MNGCRLRADLAARRRDPRITTSYGTGELMLAARNVKASFSASAAAPPTTAAPG